MSCFYMISLDSSSNHAISWFGSANVPIILFLGHLLFGAFFGSIIGGIIRNLVNSNEFYD